MNFISPILSDEEEQRRKNRRVQDGEYISFDIMLRDGQRATFLTDGATDAGAINDAAYRKSIEGLNAWRNTPAAKSTSNVVTNSDASESDALSRSIANLNAWRGK